MLRDLLPHPANMGFQYMIPVQKRHDAILLDPYFIFCMLCDMVQGRDVKLELAGFGELSETCAERAELRAGDGGSEVCDAGAHVVDAVFLDPEDVRVAGGGR